MRILPKPIRPLVFDHFLSMGNIWPLFYHDRPGRTERSSREPSGNSNTIPGHYDVTEVTVDTDEEPEEPEKPEEIPAGPTEPITVKQMDLRISLNVDKHHTDLYDLTKPPEADVPKRKPQLVVRRGQTFEIAIKTDRKYNAEYDVLHVVLEIDNSETGEVPKVSKGTKVDIDIEQGLRPRHWGVKIAEQDGERLELEIQPRPDCIIGKWKLIIESSLKNVPEDERPAIKRHKHKELIYILFNPWCEEDQVYLEDEDLVDEYVMNDKGKLYSGNYRSISYKPWSYHQFEEIVLDCSLYLLDVSNLSYKVRGDCAAVCRVISAIVNSSDDNGLLQGNWSGKYDGGTRPTQWTGSLQILEEFWKTRKTVKYGQCWVFAALTTTVCRALGIPCRPVTNFASAHDCDGSISIDVHWDENNEPMDYLNEDSVWNFHVWNEAWMKRPDLLSGYGGWQAFDATPQETSSGIYCAGPASVKAIKEGRVNYLYDGAFIFAEVNADKIHWILTKNNTWKKSYEKAKVGKSISTKWPRHKRRPFDRSVVRDRHDITEEYKFKEGTDEERASVYQANLYSSRPDIYDRVVDDMKFWLDQDNHVFVGTNFDIVLKMQNKSREERNVHTTLTLYTVYYTGVKKAKIFTKRFDTTVNGIEGNEVMVKVAAEDYVHLIAEQTGFVINVVATVNETGQHYATNEDFRLWRPELEIQAPATATVGETFDALISLESPMPIPLTECSWLIEGAGLLKATRVNQADLQPYDRVRITVPVTPFKPGEDRELIASFTSTQLSDVRGFKDILVIPRDAPAS